MSGSLGSLVQEYVRAQCTVILEARGRIEGRDEDAVHPVRVAIRRLRATLSTFGGVYDPELRASFAKELRWAGAALGRVRDLQVLADRFTAEDDAVGAARAVIAAQLDRDRVAAWHALTAELASARGTALLAEIARWKDEPPFRAKADRPAGAARKHVEKADGLVRARLRRAHAAADAGRASAGPRLHAARKAAKRHRYALELAQPVLGADAREAIERRESLQDVLGEHQDATVAVAYLRSIDLDAADPEAARAMADLVSRTQQRADRVAEVLREADRLDR